MAKKNNSEENFEEECDIDEIFRKIKAEQNRKMKEAKDNGTLVELIANGMEESEKIFKKVRNRRGK